jgi:hypothetical protein
LDDEKVSAEHARLSLENGELWIEDFGSTNGTWVDKRKIKANSKTRMTAGSTILIGKTELKIESVLESAAALSPGEAGAAVRNPEESIEAGAPLPDLLLAGESIEAARHRLSSVYEISMSLGAVETLDGLAATLLDHLNRAFPNVGRNGHSGLLLGSDLALRAFRPEDEPPACSLTLARHAWSQKKGCLWQAGAPGGVEKSVSLLSAGIHSAMYAPIIWKDEVLGVLYLDVTSRQSPFNADDLRMLQIIAAQAAIFIKNLSLQQAIQR